MAAGAGTRLGATEPKAFVSLAGTPIVRWALNRVLACPEVTRVIMVVPATEVARAQHLISGHERDRVLVVPGGADRTDSVRLGLAHVRQLDDVVLVHDAARCLAPPALFSRVVHAIRAGHDAVVPGVEVADTMKQIDDAGRVVRTLDRSRLRAIQTPQGFVRELLVDAHVHAGDSRLNATDDAALVEASGAPVLVIPGDPSAQKITTVRDLRNAERLVAELAESELAQSGRAEIDAGRHSDPDCETTLAR